MTEFENIPVIDVAAIHRDDKQAKLQLAEKFAQTYSTTGFGYITNHGVPQKLIDRVFAASKRFHASSREQKMSVELNSIHRGFIPINTSTDVNSKLADVKKPNQSESFIVMREDADDAACVLNNDYLAGSNQWPDIDGFRFVDLSRFSSVSLNWINPIKENYYGTRPHRRIQA